MSSITSPLPVLDLARVYRTFFIWSRKIPLANLYIVLKILYRLVRVSDSNKRRNRQREGDKLLFSVESALAVFRSIEESAEATLRRLLSSEIVRLAEKAIDEEGGEGFIDELLREFKGLYKSRVGDQVVGGAFWSLKAHLVVLGRDDEYRQVMENKLLGHRLLVDQLDEAIEHVESGASPATVPLIFELFLLVRSTESELFERRRELKEKAMQMIVLLGQYVKPDRLKEVNELLPSDPEIRHLFALGRLSATQDADRALQFLLKMDGLLIAKPAGESAEAFGEKILQMMWISTSDDANNRKIEDALATLRQMEGGEQVYRDIISRAPSNRIGETE